MKDDQEALRRDERLLLDVLRDAGAAVKSNSSIRCPFHDDQHASSGIYCDDKGVWRFKCQACGEGGDLFDVQKIAKIGRRNNTTQADRLKLSAVDLNSHKGKEHEPTKRTFATLQEMQESIRNVQATYAYTNPATGRHDMVVFRIVEDGGKRFFQGHVGPEGRYVLSAPPKPWPLYNRTRVAASGVVFVVEGEKCVHAMAEIGVVATTSPGGAGKAQYADWSPLAGKDCVLWPDNDAVDPKTGKRTGVEHMRDVARILQSLTPAAKVHMVDPDELGLPVKGDAVEFIAMFGEADAETKRDAVLSLMETATTCSASADVMRRIEAAIAGEIENTPLPWPVFSDATNALLPGTVTVLCGDPGDGKSFWILQAAAFWAENNIPFAVLELEEDHTHHMNRVLAQLAREGNLTDVRWINLNPETARDYARTHAVELDRIGRSIHEASDAATLTDIAAWIDERFAAGSRVVVVDPVTAAATTKEPWVEDQAFIMRVKSSAKSRKGSVILVTHPKKGAKSSFMGDLAGGSAYQRFAQTIAWMRRVNDPEREPIEFQNGVSYIFANRTLHILKARNGHGAGRRIACEFDSRSLTFREFGLIREKPERPNDEIPAYTEAVEGFQP